MGKKNRERVARIVAGIERPIQQAIALSARGVVARELEKGSTSNQVTKLNELVGTGMLSDKVLKSAIMAKAPGEMDKAIKKYRKEGKPITVESLLTEVRSEPGFLALCARVGLDYGWFEQLAQERMKKTGIV